MRTHERGVGNMPFIALLVLLVVALAMFFMANDKADKATASAASAKQSELAARNLAVDAGNAYDGLVEVLGVSLPELARTDQQFPAKADVQRALRTWLDGQVTAIKQAGQFQLSSKNYQVNAADGIVVETQGDTIVIKAANVSTSADTHTVAGVLGSIPRGFSFVTQVARENNEKFENTLTNLRSEVSNKESALQNAQTSYTADLAQKQAQLDQRGQELSQVQDSLQEATARIDALETERATVQSDAERTERTLRRELQALTDALRNERERKALALAEDPKDGEILVVGSRGTVHINLGRANKVSRGTMFKVWTVGQGGLRENYAVVRVIAVDDTRSEATIVERMNSRPVTAGMYVSNPFYDPRAPLRVHIYGDLKDYPTEVAKRRLAQTGVEISEALDDTVDVIVLGEPSVMTDEVVDEEEAAMAERKAAFERERRLARVLERAASIGAIVVTEDVLRTFVQY